ncbi:hypothetical protein IAR50_005152 [Cryptococcus sp. DSM 104548]
MSPLALLQHLPAALVSGVSSLIHRLTSSSSTPLLPFIPKYVKVILLLLLITNSGSWPFVWHVRVWYFGIKAYYLAWRKGNAKYLSDWKKANDRSGGVKGLRVRHKRIAGIDDCDYNLHLSNSCYAKNSDSLKMDFCIQLLSPVFTPGAHMALGATHYNFFKEVPIGMEYTMEAYTLGWDEKWLFFACEFLIYPKGKKSKGSAAKDKAISGASSAVSSSAPHIVPSISGTSTPVPSGTATPSNPSVLSNRCEELKKAWVARRQAQPREDGGVLCCLSISEYCLKMGRVTIPPRVALWLALQSPDKAQQERAKAIVLGKDHGRAFLRGGWKEEPNAETLGLDIGLEDGEAFGDSWVRKGAESMEKVLEGVSAF